jgi:meromycolic acid enoyl-[acyl-carrier-protein] reductase
MPTIRPRGPPHSMHRFGQVEGQLRHATLCTTWPQVRHTRKLRAIATSISVNSSKSRSEQHVGVLDEKVVLITGVLTDDSLAFAAAKIAEHEGATLILSGFGRGLSLTTRTARKLATTPVVLELDATNEEQLAAAASYVEEHFGHLDGLVHSIGFAPERALGHGMFEADWADVATTLQISAYSLKSLTAAFVPLMRRAGGGAVVGLDFDAAMAWPGYDWMGVAKAAYESLARYLARDLGKDNIRVNLIAAGPIRTIAAKSIPGFSLFEDVWAERAPLGWDVRADQDVVGKGVVALLSDFFARTTGEIIHVDGGFHAVGA